MANLHAEEGRDARQGRGEVRYQPSAPQGSQRPHRAQKRAARPETNLDETYDHSEFKASPEEYSASVRYKVKRGETLSSIARKHHTTVARIKTINGLKTNNLRIGQRLVIYQDQRPVVKRVSVSYRPKVRRVSN